MYTVCLYTIHNYIVNMKYILKSMIYTLKHTHTCGFTMVHWLFLFESYPFRHVYVSSINPQQWNCNTEVNHEMGMSHVC